MLASGRLRFKIFTSFAIAALGVIALVRLTAIAPPSSETAFAYLVLGLLIAAALWRGFIYIRAARGPARP
jgi:hypothetical protein